MRKLVKIFSLLTAIIMTFSMCYPEVAYARSYGEGSFVSRGSGNGSGGSGNSGGTITPSDSSLGTINSDTNNSSDDSDSGDDGDSGGGGGDVDIYHITSYYSTQYISGNAYEYLGQVPSDELGTDSEDLLSNVQWVRVSVTDRNGNVLNCEGASTYTDANGGFYLRPHQSGGSYYLKFTLGVPSNYSNIEEVKGTLALNSQDYFIVAAPDGQQYRCLVDVETEQIETMPRSSAEESIKFDKTSYEIKQSGKAASQVYIVLDCSPSMIIEDIEVDGVSMSKLDAAVKAAKELINNLLSSGKNIYIGLVFFRDTAYRAMGLTKNESFLDQELDFIAANATDTSRWSARSTDVKLALLKAQESFIEDSTSDNSNRNIVIITDGNPTKADGVDTYNCYSAAEYESRLYNQIYPPTISTLQQMTSDGIYLSAVLIPPKDPDDLADAEMIFGGYTDLFIKASDDEFIDSVSEEIYDEIIDNTMTDGSSSSKTAFNEKVSIIHGIETSSTVSGSFSYDANGYISTRMFSMIDEYSGSSEDMVLAQKLSSSCNMTYVCGQYSLNAYDEKYPDFEGWSGPRVVPIYKTDPETGEEVFDHNENHYYGTEWVLLGYNNQDIYISKKPETEATIDLTLTRFTVTRANGTIVYDQVIEKGDEENILYSLEDEIANGTIIDEQYSLTIKNPSSIQLNAVDILLYLPTNMTINEDKIPSGRVGNYTIKFQDQSYLESNRYMKEQSDKTIYSTAVLSLDCNLNDTSEENRFYVPTNGEYTIEFTISAKVTSVENLNFNQKAAAEIMTYRNSASRRMCRLSSSGYKTYFTSITAANGLEDDYAQCSNTINIVPVTGFTSKELKMYYFKNTFIGFLAGVVTVGGAYLFIRRKNGKHRKIRKAKKL